MNNSVLYIQLRVVDGDSLFVLRDAPSLDPRYTILLSPAIALTVLSRNIAFLPCLQHTLRGVGPGLIPRSPLLYVEQRRGGPTSSLLFQRPFLAVLSSTHIHCALSLHQSPVQGNPKVLLVWSHNATWSSSVNDLSSSLYFQ